jgi:hypothetical protein
MTWEKSIRVKPADEQIAGAVDAQELDIGNDVAARKFVWCFCSLAEIDTSDLLEWDDDVVSGESLRS